MNINNIYVLILYKLLNIICIKGYTLMNNKC